MVLLELCFCVYIFVGSYFLVEYTTNPFFLMDGSSGSKLDTPKKKQEKPSQNLNQTMHNYAVFMVFLLELCRTFFGTSIYRSPFRWQAWDPEPRRPLWSCHTSPSSAWSTKKTHDVARQLSGPINSGMASHQLLTWLTSNGWIPTAGPHGSSLEEGSPQLVNCLQRHLTNYRYNHQKSYLANWKTVKDLPVGKFRHLSNKLAISGMMPPI